MKKIITLLLFFFIISFSNVFSQDNSGQWEPVYLQVTGHNVMDGVEASFNKTTCGIDDVVLIKFTNTNEYPVSLAWADAVFTQDLKWVYREGDNTRRLLIVPAKSEVTGNCSNEESVLVVKLNALISDSKKFKRFHTSQLVVSPVK